MGSCETMLFCPFILKNGFHLKMGERYRICINYEQFEKQQEVKARLRKVDESYFGLTFAFFSELLLP